MSSLFAVNSSNPWIAGILELPASRAAWMADAGAPAERQPLLTDSVGTMTLTLQNMVAGSRWRLEVLATGALVAEGDATGADTPITLAYYQPNQTLRLKVRKGTASPYYRPFDTQLTVGAASVSIFVSQIADE